MQFLADFFSLIRSCPCHFHRRRHRRRHRRHRRHHPRPHHPRPQHRRPQHRRRHRRHHRRHLRRHRRRHRRHRHLRRHRRRHPQYYQFPRLEKDFHLLSSDSLNLDLWNYLMYFHPVQQIRFPEIGLNRHYRYLDCHSN